MTDTSTSLSTPAELAAQVAPVTPAASVKRRRTWDLVLSIALMITGIGQVATLALMGVTLVFASDSCGSNICNEAQLSTGMLVAIGLPVVVMIAGIAVTIVFLVKRKLAFWVITSAIVAAALAWGLGALLVFTAVPGFL